MGNRGDRDRGVGDNRDRGDNQRRGRSPVGDGRYGGNRPNRDLPQRRDQYNSNRDNGPRTDRLPDQRPDRDNRRGDRDQDRGTGKPTEPSSPSRPGEPAAQASATPVRKCPSPTASARSASQTSSHSSKRHKLMSPENSTSELNGKFFLSISMYFGILLSYGVITALLVCKFEEEGSQKEVIDFQAVLILYWMCTRYEMLLFHFRFCSAD